MKFSVRKWRVARRVLLGGLWMGAASFAFTVGRSRNLLLQGRKIERQSAGFARDYHLGSSGRTVTYLVMGDSTAAGWGAGKLAETYPYRVAQALARRGFRVHVVVVAVGGATLQDVSQKQMSALETVRPDLVSLSAGANDATHFSSDAAFRRELQTVLRALQACSARAILFADTPDIFLAPALPLPFSIAAGRRARRQNQILAEELHNSRFSAPRFEVVPLFQRGKLDFHQNPALYAADRFHPSAQGYGVWAPLFIEKMGRVDFEFRSTF